MNHFVPALVTSCVITVVTVHSSFGAGLHLTVRLSEPGRFVRPDVRCLRFSPDGSQLAVAHTRGTVLIRTSDGEVTSRAKLTPRKLAWSRDGRSLLFLSHKERWLVDTLEGTGEPVSTKSVPGFIGVRLQRKNGKLLIAEIDPGSPVAALGTVHVGDELTGVGNGRTGFLHSVTSRSVERAMNLVAGPAGTTLRLSVIPHGQILPKTHVVVRHAQLMNQGRRSFRLPDAEISSNVSCLVFNDECEAFDAETGHRIRSFSLNAPAIGGFSAVSQDTGRIAVIRRSPETRKPAPPRPKLTEEERVRASSIGNIFGSIREDIAYAATHVEGFSVDVFDAATGKRTSSLAIEAEPNASLVSVPPFYGLSLTSGGSKAVAGTWSMLHVYDVSSGRREHVIRPPQTGHSRAIESFAITDRVAAVGSTDGNVWVMTFPEGDLLRTIELPDRESVEAIAISPGGTHLGFFVDSVVHLVELSDVTVGE